MKYTIIITVYNKEKYIERALKSAINQNFENYEIMVVNDGSTDNSEKIIKKYQKKHKFKYFYKENTGIADTRNFAIEKVETDYFLFLDADDYLSLDLLKTVDEYDSYDVLSFNAVNLTEMQKFIKNMNKPIYVGNGEDFFIELVKKKSEFTVPWGYIYNTKYFKDNKFVYPKGEILEDYYLTPFVIIEAKKLISIDYKGYYYVTTFNSITNSSSDIIANTYIRHFDKMINMIDKYSINLQKNFKSFLAGTLIWYGGTLTGIEQKKYIEIIKERKIINLLDRSKIKKQIIKLLYDLNIYYFMRKQLKRSKI